MPRESVEAPAEWWWIFDPRISLRARAALVVGGGAAVFVVLLAWVAGNIFRYHVQDQFGVPFEALALQVSDRIDRVFYERYAALQVAASQAALRRRDATPADIRQTLDALLQGQPDFGWLGFADSHGNITAATQKMLEGTNVSQVPWFLIGRQRPYAAHVHAVPELARLSFDAEEPARYLDFAVPVTTPEGSFLGVLGAYVQMPPTREIQPTITPELARARHLGVTVYGAAGDVLLDTGGSGWTDPPVAPGVRQPRGSFVETTGLGTTYFTGFMWSRGFRDFPGLGWLVTVRQPVRDAFAPARRLQREIIAWGVAFVIALTALTWWFAGRFVRRMAIVENAAKLIQQGDILTVLPHPRGDGEIERMCAALDNLVEDLRAKTPKPIEQPPSSERRPW
jgi:hypothetical protein